MAVIAAYIYRDGVRERAIDPTDPDALGLAPGEFAWIGLLDPTDQELLALQNRFGLHPLAIEDAIKGRQMPKLDIYGDQLFIVAKPAHFDGDQIGYGETHIFVGPHHIITVRHGSTRSYSDLRTRLEATPALLGRGGDYVLHAVLDYIVDGYIPIVEAIEDEILAVENAALDAFLSRAQITRLFKLRGELTRFRRVLDPTEDVVARLEHHEAPCIDPDVRPYFRDVRDHVRKVIALTDGQRDVLTSVFEVSTLLEQQRQSEITRRLAAWAAMLAVPTAIAGIYGMNFDVMPELRWKYSYFVVMGVIIAICAVLFVRFKKARWL